MIFEITNENQKILRYEIKKVNLPKSELNFIYKVKENKNKKTLLSEIEINKDVFLKAINMIEPRSSIICESGYSFNKPEDLLKLLPNHNIMYFILSPAIGQLRKNYCERSTRKNKNPNNEEDWKDYKIFDDGLRRNEILKNKISKLKNDKTDFIEIREKYKDIDYYSLLEKVKEKILKTDKPTLFFIVGPNSSGKSTLLVNLLQSFVNNE